jgi:8-oxo-dGTP pyrophosphatase MutT (NUDIX family)
MQIEKTYKRQWIASDNILSQHISYLPTQIYCWVISKDNKFIIVSKDGENWQFPGGKPEANETLKQTTVRELKEEAGLDTSKSEDDIKFFGYYLVQELEGDNLIKEFLQVRTYLRLDATSNEVELKPEERESEKEEDRINFVKFVSFEEGKENIAWFSKSIENNGEVVSIDKIVNLSS